MSKEKQIEEMTIAICGNYADGYCVGGDCGCEYGCAYEEFANRFYSAGYRKSTDVAEEIFAELDKRLDDITIVMGALDSLRTFHKTIEKVTAEVNELKKKYTEVGNE